MNASSVLTIKTRADQHISNKCSHHTVVARSSGMMAIDTVIDAIVYRVRIVSILDWTCGRVSQCALLHFVSCAIRLSCTSCMPFVTVTGLTGLILILIKKNHEQLRYARDE